MLCFYLFFNVSWSFLNAGFFYNLIGKNRHINWSNISQFYEWPSIVANSENKTSALKCLWLCLCTGIHEHKIINGTLQGQKYLIGHVWATQRTGKGYIILWCLHFQGHVGWKGLTYFWIDIYDWHPILLDPTSFYGRHSFRYRFSHTVLNWMFHPFYIIYGRINTL